MKPTVLFVAERLSRVEVAGCPMQGIMRSDGFPLQFLCMCPSSLWLGCCKLLCLSFSLPLFIQNVPRLRAKQCKKFLLIVHICFPQQMPHHVPDICANRNACFNVYSHKIQKKPLKVPWIILTLYSKSRTSIFSSSRKMSSPPHFIDINSRKIFLINVKL